MSLFRRTLLVVTAWLMIALGAVYLIANHVLMGGFRELEMVHMRRNADRASAAVQVCTDELSSRLRDWSNWNDTYAFALDHNQEYIHSNLNDESQNTIGNDAIWITGPDGRTLWARMRGPDGRFADMSLAMDARLSRLAIGLACDGSGIRPAPPNRAGLIMIDDEAYLLAIQPILSSNRQGPSRGAIAFMRRFQPLADQRLSHLLLFRTHTLGPSDPLAGAPSFPASGVNWISTAQSPLAWTDRADPNLAGISIRLATLDGLIGPTLRIEYPREIFQYGRLSVGYFFAVVAVSGLVLAAVSLFGLHALILRRVIDLGQDVDGVAVGAGVNRVRESGQDEITALARRINQLLSVLGAQERNLRNRASELEDARRRAVDADAAKTQFLANMSHEIRTPMTAMLGFADLMASGDDGPQGRVLRREAADTIRRNGEHLLAVISDLLDISKIEAGRMSVESVPCDAGVIVNDLRMLMGERAQALGLSLHVNVPSGPLLVRTDPTRLRQIVLNLLSNAVKFTPAPPEGPGRIDLLVRLRPAGETVSGRHELVIEVRDTGIGITPEQAGRLFQPFTQADASTTRKFGGTGLGLSISRRLAELMGGTLALAGPGSDGVGARFVLTLPVELCERISGGSTLGGDRTDGGVFEGAPRILVVDDGPDNRRLIGRLLTLAGARVEFCEDGQQALARLGDSRQPASFELILMDMQMPGLDGYETTARLRHLGFTIPIVAITAHAGTDDRARCLSAGCDDYLVKPIDRARLYSICRAWLGRAGAASAPEQSSMGKGG